VRQFSITSKFAECACAPGAHVHYVRSKNSIISALSTVLRSKLVESVH
jgi:hypothetical protein